MKSFPYFICVIFALPSHFALAQVTDDFSWSMQRCSGATVIKCDTSPVPFLSMNLARRISGESAKEATIEYLSIKRIEKGIEVSMPSGMLNNPIVISKSTGNDEMTQFAKRDAESLFVTAADIDGCADTRRPCDALATLLPFIGGTWTVGKKVDGNNEVRWPIALASKDSLELNGWLSASARNYDVTIGGKGENKYLNLAPGVNVTEELRYDLKFKRLWTEKSAQR